jgi:hypothetical protein
MKLVMVHGRAQQAKDPVALEEEWRDALAYGLARGNAALAPETEYAFPYYGDKLVELISDLADPLEPGVIARGAAPDERAPELRGQIMLELAEGLGLTEDDVQREVPHEALERGPQNWGWVRAIARAIDRIPGLNGEAIDLFTRDVYVYLTNDGVRRQIKAIVAAAIPDNEPFVLLAHSLGTIVTYDILCDRGVNPKCVRLVTVGCPLGIKAIRPWLRSPLESPACVDNWFNAFDRRDVVALRPLDAANFDVEPPIDNDPKVVNFTDNRHGIAGYLSDPLVAQKLADATHQR